jgi:hypothetical protein
MKIFAYIGIGILALVSVVALSVGGSGLNYWLNKTFSPLNEQVRHDTFECSQSHTDGLVHEIRDYRDQYGRADAAGKAVLRQRVMQDFNSYTCGDLPSDVQSFVNSIR